MKPLIERQGNWSIAVGDLDVSAGFEASEWRHEVVQAESSTADPIEILACAEVLQFGGGLTPRALVGATFVSGRGELIFEVGSTGLMTLGASRECPSSLAGPLVRGLPSEFVEAVLEGLGEMAGRVGRPAGTVRIEAAGYDEEDSSPHAFRHAGAALMWLVNKQLQAPSEPIQGLAEMAAIW